MSKTDDISSSFILLTLPAEELDFIIGSTLKDMGYKVKCESFGAGTYFTVSDKRGDIARIKTSSLEGKRFTCRWFGDELSEENRWRVEETERIESALHFAVRAQQKTNDVVARGGERIAPGDQEATSGYGMRMDTAYKIEKLMGQRLEDRGSRRTTRQQAYGRVGIDNGTVKKHVPEIHERWRDWESGWEHDWKRLVGWEEIRRSAN